MALTYRELIENLKSLPDARLDDNVTVFVRGDVEFYPLVDDYPFLISSGEDVLDDGHPYLVI